MLREGLLNFSKGEIAEELVARVDVPSYKAGCKRAENVIILKYGGLTKRPGTRLVGQAYSSTQPVRLLPFQFSLTQAYALEMGQGYMRPAALGGRILETPLTISSLTKAVNAQVTAAFHGYSVGDEVYFNDVVGMVEINGLTGIVQTIPDGNNFTVNIDSRGFSTFVGDSAGTVNSSPPPPPPPPPAVPPPPPPPPGPSVGGGGSYVDSGGIFRGGNAR